jgi:hypothetical protein
VPAEPAWPRCACACAVALGGGLRGGPLRARASLLPPVPPLRLEVLGRHHVLLGWHRAAAGAEDALDAAGDALDVVRRAGGRVVGHRAAQTLHHVGAVAAGGRVQGAEGSRGWVRQVGASVGRPRTAVQEARGAAREPGGRRGTSAAHRRGPAVARARARAPAHLLPDVAQQRCRQRKKLPPAPTLHSGSIVAQFRWKKRRGSTYALLGPQGTSQSRRTQSSACGLCRTQGRTRAVRRRPRARPRLWRRPGAPRRRRSCVGGTGGEREGCGRWGGNGKR